jgi:hypothetical protein
MDAVLLAAGRALTRGDALGALKLVALRDEAQALALRATALAQLGEYALARKLFLRAMRGFSAREELARARCVVALAEVALAARELSRADHGLDQAVALLLARGDRGNARHAQLLGVRLALSLGDVSLAQQKLRSLDARGLPAATRSLLALAQAEVALRQIEPEVAARALARAMMAAQEARIPPLCAEVETAQEALGRPVARLLGAEASAALSLAQVAALLRGPQLVIDGCRRLACQGTESVSFATRPVLFALACRLAESAPGEVERDELIRVAFGMQRANESLRVRLRVSLGRLRHMLRPLARLEATPGGFALRALRGGVCVLLPPFDDAAARLLALLSGGEAWSSSALALALGASQRNVQRALVALEAAGKAQSVGQGRKRRWLAPPMTQFATHLLLPAPSHIP